MEFDRHLGSIVAKAQVKFQSNKDISITNLAASKNSWDLQFFSYVGKSYQPLWMLFEHEYGA